MKSSQSRDKANDVCNSCPSLLDLRDMFSGLVHTGKDLRRRKRIYSKPAGATYPDVKSQNEFLLKVAFDGKGNDVYHRDCIRAAYGVSTQRLARLRKAVQVQASESVEFLPKQSVAQRQRLSDVVLPRHCDQATSRWLESQFKDALIPCQKQQMCHGNARK